MHQNLCYTVLSVIFSRGYYKTATLQKGTFVKRHPAETQPSKRHPTKRHPLLIKALHNCFLWLSEMIKKVWSIKKGLCSGLWYVTSSKLVCIYLIPHYGHGCRICLLNMVPINSHLFWGHLHYKFVFCFKVFLFFWVVFIFYVNLFFFMSSSFGGHFKFWGCLYF